MFIHLCKISNDTENMVYKINLSIQLDKISITTFSYFCFYSRTIPWNIDRETFGLVLFLSLFYLFIFFNQFANRFATTNFLYFYQIPDSRLLLPGRQLSRFHFFASLSPPFTSFEGDHHPQCFLSLRYIEIPMYRMCNSSIIASSGRWHNTVYS